MCEGRPRAALLFSAPSAARCSSPALPGGDPRRGPVRSAKHNLAAHLPARHIEGLRGRIHELIHRLHGEVESHEFDDGLEAGECRADTQSCKTMLCYWRIDNAAVTKFLQKPLRDFICALIFRDLLSENKDILVAAHLLGHCIA